VLSAKAARGIVPARAQRAMEKASAERRIWCVLTSGRLNTCETPVLHGLKSTQLGRLRDRSQVAADSVWLNSARPSVSLRLKSCQSNAMVYRCQ
jgi:hypothetical protein